MASTEKGESLLPKLVAERIGRLFNLLFNRVSMYSLDHPTTKETINHLTEAFKQGLQHVSPLTVILDRENIYIEEELLDPRVNLQRLVSHMKNAGVQSVSFERGCGPQDFIGFARVFGDTKMYPTADAMKRGLVEQGLKTIRINHVFFKKMTADERVVDKTAASGGASGGLTEIVIDASADSDSSVSTASSSTHHLPGFSQDLNLSLLIRDPSMVSQQLLDAEDTTQGAPAGSAGGESAIIHGIRQLRQQLDAAGSGSESSESAEDLVGAVFRLKEKIRSGLELRKRQGEEIPGEEIISREMDDLTDQVMIQLVREEYKKGEITVRRLAQILRRMIPDVRELKRLLPKLKEVLLAEGMAAADYLHLIHELERELQSEELALVLEEGAEGIGLSVEELIGEIREDPGGAASLIVLAAEIRSLGKGGDQDILSQVLVDYVEKVGKELAFERARKDGPEGVEHLRQIIAQVQDDILRQMQGRLGDRSLANRVQTEVQQKRDTGQGGVKDEFFLYEFMRGSQALTEPQALVNAVEKAYSDPSRQGEALESVVKALEERGLDSGPLLDTLAKRSRVTPGEEDPQKAPKGTFNRTMILFFLREEVKRARRYQHTFSTILVSIKQAKALKPIPIGMILPHEIRNVLMVQLTEHLRDVDLVGCLEENKILVLLPFTGAEGVAAVHKKLIKNLHGETLAVRNVPMQVSLAMAEESFQKEKTPTVRALITELDKGLFEALKS